MSGRTPKYNGRLLGVAIFLLVFSPHTYAQQANAPMPIAGIDLGRIFVKLPMGTIGGFVQGDRDGMQTLTLRTSSDNGKSWSAPREVFALPNDSGPWAGPPEVLLDRDGEIHLFFLRYEKKPSRDWTHENLNLWHVRSTHGRTQWLRPNQMWRGYTGGINSVVQMRSGRIVLPFSYYTGRRWNARGANAYVLYAPFSSTTVYSDDDGETWRQSPDELKIIAPNLTDQEEGAIEPVVIELRDGRLWMLMRTQLGRFYESFSSDGAHWSAAKASNIIDSDSAAGLVRLKDGRLLLLWNCSLRYAYANGGRPVLLGAISEDEGRTWRGSREVVRDHHRNAPPPSPSGDFGTAYPYPIVLDNGQVLLTTGQGRSRVTVLLDPQWLSQDSQVSNFEKGIDDWSVYGTRGAELKVPPGDTKPVLSIRRSDPEWPSGAVWNFPIGQKGRLKLRLAITKDFGGDTIGLTDHFSAPFDDQDTLFNVFNIRILAGGRINGTVLSPDNWHEVELSWDTTARTCNVVVDGKRSATIRAQRVSSGVNYLRFHVTSDHVDPGMLIESVNVQITPPSRRQDASVRRNATSR